MKKKHFIYLFSLIYNLAINLFQPFLNIYAYYLKFPKEVIGKINALGELTSDLTRVFSGYVYSIFKSKKTVFSLILVFYSLLAFSFHFVKDITFFSLLIMFKAILDSFFIVGYAIILANYFRKKDRIGGISFLNLAASLGSMIASMLTGILSFFMQLNIVFLISSFLFLISATFIFPIRIKEMDKTKRKSLKMSKEFVSFLIIYSLFLFSVGISSPYFSILLIDTLKLKPIHWSSIIVIETLSMLTFSNEIIKMIKKFGYVKVFLFSTFFISLNPLIWVYFKNFKIILIWSVVSGIGWYTFNTASLAYLTKMLRINSEMRAGIFYLISGVFLSFGYFLGSSFLKCFSLSFIFYFSSLLRFVTSSFFLLIKRGKEKMIENYLFFPRILVGRMIISLNLFNFLIRSKLKKIRL